MVNSTIAFLFQTLLNKMFSGDSLFAFQVSLDHALRRAAVLSFPGFGEEEAIAVGALHDSALRTARAPNDCAAAEPLRDGIFTRSSSGIPMLLRRLNPWFFLTPSYFE